MFFTFYWRAYATKQRSRLMPLWKYLCIGMLRKDDVKFEQPFVSAVLTSLLTFSTFGFILMHWFIQTEQPIRVLSLTDGKGTDSTCSTGQKAQTSADGAKHTAKAKLTDAQCRPNVSWPSAVWGPLIFECINVLSRYNLCESLNCPNSIKQFWFLNNNNKVIK